MMKSKGIRFMTIALYITSLVIFVGITIIFSYVYQRNYIESKAESASIELKNKVSTYGEAIDALTLLGYDVNYTYSLTDQRTIHNYINPKSITIDDEFRIHIGPLVTAELNKSIISRYSQDLFIVMIITVVIYISVSLIFVQHFVLQIVNPLIAINEELENVSKFNFDTPKLDIDSYGEIESLANSVENIKISLRAYSKHKKQLTNALVHEIKSPLTSISSAIQLNQLGHDEYDYDTTMSIIEQGVNEIIEITNMALDIFEKQKMYKITKQNIYNLFLEELVKVKPILDQKLIRIDINESSSIWSVDENSFSLIISNLMTNVCKYAKTDSTVTIDIYDDVITVSNEIAKNFTSGTGMGIKIVSNMLLDMGYNLDHFSKDNVYNVVISKNTH